MKYLLDSNVCIDFLTGRFPQVTGRIQSLLPEDLCLSSIVIAELRYGADKSVKARRNHELLNVLTDEIPSRDFDTAAATTYGKVRTALEKKGQPIGPNDMLIAAHALSLGLVLVTDNVGEFRRVRGLSACAHASLSSSVRSSHSRCSSPHRDLSGPGSIMFGLR